VRHEVASGTITVEEMTHRFLLVHEMDKVRVLAAIARHHPRTLAFVRSKRGADHLAVALKKEGIAAAAIHGDLHQRHRERALSDFSRGKLAVLVATDVAARGLDIDDIDIVVHYDPPQDSKDYLHRSGRTARAGRDGWAVTLVEYNQHTQMRILQRTLRLPLTPPIEVFSNDPRLHDFAAFNGE
jgi:superfamily II DNA/RNA helicase